MVLNSNLVSAFANFSYRYDQLMRAVSRDATTRGYAPAECHIIESLFGRRLSHGQLRELTQIEKGQLSRALKTMISKGYVEQTTPTHSRPVYQLSQLGICRYDELRRGRLQATEAALGKMLRSDRKALVDALIEFRDFCVVNDETEEVYRVRTAYPQEVAQIVKNALEFYSRRSLGFNTQIEGYVLGQFAKACERTYHYVIVYEAWGYVAGSLQLLNDRKASLSRLEGLWFEPGWYEDDDVVNLIQLAEKRAISGGSTKVIARIPRHDAWPNLFPELGWVFDGCTAETIADVELQFETWSNVLHR